MPSILRFCWSLLCWDEVSCCVFLLGLYVDHDWDLQWSLEYAKYSYVRMICGAVYHGDNGKCCSDSVMSTPMVASMMRSEWLLCELWWLWLQYLWGCDCDLDLLCLYLSQCWCLEVDLVWCLVLDYFLWWRAGVPEGGIQSGKSITIWLYSLHSKQCILGQWHAMWPDSWYWKHLSSSWDITFTMNEGNRVVVSCCDAWSFSILLMVSARVWGAFS